jgi:hypothetical protein
LLGAVADALCCASRPEAGVEGRMGRACFGRRGGAWCAAALLAVVVCATTGLARGEPRTSRSSILELRNLMTRAEFQASGLDKLSQQELALLDGWVGRLVARVLANRKQAGCTSPIDSRIDGEFEGWSGHTVFPLENGQVWKQLGSAASYAYRISPKVQIYKAGSSCAMRVEGMAEVLLVQRLK